MIESDIIRSINCHLQPIVWIFTDYVVMFDTKFLSVQPFFFLRYSGWIPEFQFSEDEYVQWCANDDWGRCYARPCLTNPLCASLCKTK